MAARVRGWRLVALVALLALAASACSSSDDDDDASASADASADDDEVAAGQEGEDEGGDDSGDSLLAEVQDRGTLMCGVNEAVPGFGFIDEAGDFAGFDIEFCRVIAAAVLGDAEAVEFMPLTAEQRFTALQSGEIDVLVRNTTWNATRDGGEGAAFATTTFFDGQGMMVRVDSGFGSLADMGSTSVCSLSGTTTEANITSAFAAAGVEFTLLTFDEVYQIREAFVAGQCQGWTSDSSQLAGQRSTFPDAQGGPEALVIFEERISKEPLGPVVRDGDDDWFDAVNWAVIATMQAEEFDITTANVAEQIGSDNPDILRFLGEAVAGDDGAAVFDPGFGLETDFARTIVEQVGNYAEIYDRNVGSGSALDLERGLNALYTDGGLHYPPPYR